MNKNLMAAFAGGVLVAGAGAWLLQTPAAEERAAAKEVVVAQVEEPRKDNGSPSPEAPAETPAAPAPVRRMAEKSPVEKPAPRKARPVESTPAPSPQKGASSVVPRHDAPPLPVFLQDSPAAAPSAPVVTPPAPAVAETPAPPPPAPKKREPQSVTIAEGTVLTVRTAERLSSENMQAGDSFNATLAEPLVVDGFVLAERGARVTGRVAEAAAAGRVKGVSKLSLELTQVALSDGQKLALTTDPFVREGATSRKNDAAKVGAGAAIGAALGAIIGGGKGAAVGAASGGAAGGGVVLATRGKPVEIESEARLPFRLSKSLKVIEQIR
jgi:hypothetical protein